MYLSPSCGAAGLFFTGTGFTGSISSPGPDTQSALVGFTHGSRTKPLVVQRYRWSGSLCGWEREPLVSPSSSLLLHCAPSRSALAPCCPLSSFSSLEGRLFFTSSECVRTAADWIEASTAPVPAGELLLPDTLWERMVAIQQSTSTDASFLRSAGEKTRTRGSVVLCRQTL